MSIDDKTKEKIEQATKAQVLDYQFHFDFHRILEENKDEALDRYVSFIAKGKENMDFEGKHVAIGNIYTAQTTYRKVLDLIKNPDFTYIQKARQLHPLKPKL